MKKLKNEKKSMEKDVMFNIMKTSIFLFSLFLLVGCFSRSKPPYIVEQYMIEYAPPAINGLSMLPESIKIERFSISQSFNTQAMVYNLHTFKYATYNYNQWRVNPADMVTDFLLRDFRDSRIFHAVFSYRDIEKSRFVVEGGLEEFLETNDKNILKAALSASVSLLNTDQKEINKRVVFQRQYKFQETIREHTPEEFAKGMSVNMSRFSEQLVKDMHKAIILITDSINTGKSGIKPDFPAKEGKEQ
jgi:cholesterol transport system auxiliary component